MGSHSLFGLAMQSNCKPHFIGPYARKEFELPDIDSPLILTSASQRSYTPRDVGSSFSKGDRSAWNCFLEIWKPFAHLEAVIMVGKNPGHSHSQTKHISFEFHQQSNSPVTFRYEYFISLPPAYSQGDQNKWPLILFLHGGGESQVQPNESYASLRHGVPKIILCYDRWKQGQTPSINIPRPMRRVADSPNDRSSEPVDTGVCEMVAENFITVTPSLALENGFGWNVVVLNSLLEMITQRYDVDTSRIHVTGFSMGGYGT